MKTVLTSQFQGVQHWGVAGWYPRSKTAYMLTLVGQHHPPNFKGSSVYVSKESFFLFIIKGCSCVGSLDAVSRDLHSTKIQSQSPINPCSQGQHGGGGKV